ncbi:MAG: tetratricopeptide repeat protein [Deltaproteobacteria bacterium]|nr:tetratricopeptide repeat protein [Deltaproteobacteria bacterium]
MKSRIIFIAILSVILGVSTFAIYRLFFFSHEIKGTESNLNRGTTKQDPHQKRPGMRLSNSVDGNESIWQDSRLKDSQVPVGQLKVSAEIENNLGLLVELYDQGHDEEFLKKLNELIAANPEVKEYVALKGDYYFNEGNWAESEKSIRRLIELNPENMFAQTSLAEVLAIQGQSEEAIKTQQNVLQKDPRNLAAMNGLLAVSEMKGDTQAGEDYVKRLMEQDPTNGNAAAIYGQLLRDQGNVEDAEKVFREAHLRDPGNPVLTENLVVEEIRKGRYANAFDLGIEASDRFSHKDDKFRALNGSWQAAALLNDRAKMLVILNKMKDIDPNDQFVLQKSLELQHP